MLPFQQQLLLDGNGMQTHWTKESGQLGQKQQQQQPMASSTVTPARDIVHTDERAKAETETEEMAMAMADEDIGFALHWRCKVVSNVKGSRQNSSVSFSHIYGVFLFLVL